ncbi:hypothetical protein C9374_012283 [Naegleria lovaniensis]|uniref:DUF1764-domain-containing protein n=1 Tax=Naegleria lovaniensis TaxID=51637 RepID=A0AA88KDW6_NAELO|nr:uncharacterized protein C9374_012283 [Naegleria lovaniensis]KAG2373294.1 hypothetical protein C9374_012283 [Naegleria lovaniensis]
MVKQNTSQKTASSGSSMMDKIKKVEKQNKMTKANNPPIASSLAHGNNVSVKKKKPSETSSTPIKSSSSLKNNDNSKASKSITKPAIHGDEISNILNRKKKYPKEEEQEESEEEESLEPAKIDDIFESVKNEILENKKKLKQAKKASAASSSSSTSDDLFESNEEFANQKKRSGRKTIDGLAVYSTDELKIGKGGNTDLCPFDCDCCF